MNTRRQFLGGMAAAANTYPAVSKARKPNVVLVMTDDQGYGDLGCTGNPMLETLNIDRFHADSVRFTDFHVEALCAPTRAALMTGRYPYRTGVTAPVGGWCTLRPGERTMANVFAENGYRTALFGKWHLGDNHPFRAHERGFHESLTFGAGAISTTADVWGNDYYDDTYWRNGRRERVRGYCTDVFFDEALRFIESNRSRPFFLYLTPNAPHSPYVVDERYAAPYRAKGMAGMANFYGMIANLDENFGRLRKKLAGLELERDTILIFMTDNGTAAGFQPGSGTGWRGFNAGMRGKKADVYDGGHRVPFFIRWPGGAVGGGKDVSGLAAGLDVMPTLLELAGLPAPAGLRFDGRSLCPLLRGRSVPTDRTHITQHTQFTIEGRYQNDNPRPFLNSAILTNRWRLVNGKELYDIKADPGQASDLAQSHPEVVSKLRAQYEHWWEDVQEGLKEPTAIPVGMPEEDPTRLTCYEWHTGQWVAWQKEVREVKEGNGYWVIEVPRQGRYRFILRQQPEEAACPIRGSLARIQIDAREEIRPIENGAAAVTFDFDLEPGRKKLTTWFAENRGAYFVDVHRL